MFCPKCGKETARNPPFYPGCKAKLSERQATNGTPLSTVARILNILDIIDGDPRLECRGTPIKTSIQVRCYTLDRERGRAGSR